MWLQQQPEEAIAGEESCSCEPIPLGYRKGGLSKYTISHNMCADKPEFTDFPNEDIDLRNVAFDGWKMDENTLYEIKMGTFYSIIKGLSQRPSAKKFLEYLRFKAILGFYRERIPSKLCHIEFLYGAKDTELLADLKQDFTEWQNPDDANRLFDLNPVCP